MPDSQAALRDLERKGVIIYGDLASGKYDGRPCDTEPQDGKEPAPATEIAESQSIAPDGFDYVKAFEAYWPSRPR